MSTPPGPPPALDEYRLTVGPLLGTVFVVHAPTSHLIVCEDGPTAERAILTHHADQLRGHDDHRRGVVRL